MRGCRDGELYIELLTQPFLINSSVVQKATLTVNNSDGVDVDTEEDEAKRERCQITNAVSFELLSRDQYILMFRES